MAKTRAGSEEPTPAKERPKSGRVTPAKNSRAVNKRYTAPIPKSVRTSPRWYGPLLLALLLVGLFMIVGNYVGILPGGTSNWYLVSGLSAIVVGAMMATRYH